MLNYCAFARITALILEHENGTKPTYVCLKPDKASRDELLTLISSLGIKNPVSANELHATVTYSKAPISDPSKDVKEILPAVAESGRFALFDTKEGAKCLVLKLRSLDLRALHLLISKKYNASHDFPTYEPHITLCYDVGKDFELPEEKPDISVCFDDFEVKDLDDK